MCSSSLPRMNTAISHSSFAFHSLEEISWIHQQ